MNRPLRATLLASTLLALGCSRDEVQTYRIAKESAAPTPPMAMAPGAAELPPPPAGGGLKWALPQGWSEEKGGGMRFATLKAPVPGKVDISVVVLAGAAGGELANVNRWRGQIGLPPIDEKALGAARREVKTKAGTVALFDFTSEGASKSRMVTGLLSTPNGSTWFLKMLGDADPVAQAKPEFLRLMESLRFDPAN